MCDNSYNIEMNKIQTPLDNSFFAKCKGVGHLCKSRPKRTVQQSHLMDLILRNQGKAHQALETFKQCKN